MRASESSPGAPRSAELVAEMEAALARALGAATPDHLNAFDRHVVRRTALRLVEIGRASEAEARAAPAKVLAILARPGSAAPPVA